MLIEIWKFGVNYASLLHEIMKWMKICFIIFIIFKMCFITKSYLMINVIFLLKGDTCFFIPILMSLVFNRILSFIFKIFIQIFMDNIKSCLLIFFIIIFFKLFVKVFLHTFPKWSICGLSKVNLMPLKYQKPLCLNTKSLKVLPISSGGKQFDGDNLLEIS